MGRITLYPDRIVARWYQEETTLRPRGPLELAPFFFHTLTLDPDFTLGHLMGFLDGEGVDFLETVLGEGVEPVLEEARRPVDAPVPGQLDFLRVFNAHEEGRLRREFEGWGAWHEPYEGAWEEYPDWPRAGSIGVSLAPVNELLHLPLRYDPALVFRDEEGNEEYRTTLDITLLDFLKAIFFELTFHGTPGEREEMASELRRRVEEVERGEAELIPVDEFLESLRREEREGEGEG